MVAAVKIDGNVTYAKHGETHYDLLATYQNNHDVTDDEADAMLDAGRIEFGRMFLNQEMALEFKAD